MMYAARGKSLTWGATLSSCALFVSAQEIVLASQFAGRSAPASPDGYKKFGCAELTALASTGVKSGAGSGEGAIQPLAAAADFRRTCARSTTLFCDSEARLRAATYTCFLSADLLRTNSDSGVDLTAAFVVRLKKENIVNLVSLRARLRAGPA